MLKLTFPFLVSILFLACGKNSIVIEDEPIPTEKDTVYESNLIANIVDEQGVTIEGALLSIDGKNESSNLERLNTLSSLFLGNKGKVLKVEKVGFATSYTRIHNHNSIEDVFSNIILNGISTYDNPSIGDNLELNDNVSIGIIAGSINASANFEYFIVDENDNGIQIDRLFFEEDGAYSLNPTLLWNFSWQANTPSFEIQFESSFLANHNVDLYDLYHYHSINGWEKVATLESLVDNEGSITVENDGWYSISSKEKVERKTIQIKASNTIELGNVVSSIVNDNNLITNNFHTSQKGDFVAYVSSNNQLVIGTINSNLSISDHDVVEVIIDESYIGLLDVEILDCDFDLYNGYLKIDAKEGQILTKIQNGDLTNIMVKSDDGYSFSYYDSDYTKMGEDIINAEESIIPEFRIMVCGEDFQFGSVNDESSFSTSFDLCKLKETGGENICILENGGNQNVILASFREDGRGVKDGLLYVQNIIFPHEYESSVQLEILKYDKENGIFSGQVFSKYKEIEEEVLISFYGNIQ